MAEPHSDHSNCQVLCHDQPHLRQVLHTDGDLNLGAPARSLVLFLHRPAVSHVYHACWALLLLQEAYQREHFSYPLWCHQVSRAESATLSSIFSDRLFFSSSHTKKRKKKKSRQRKWALETNKREKEGEGKRTEKEKKRKRRRKLMVKTTSEKRSWTGLHVY